MEKKGSNKDSSDLPKSMSEKSLQEVYDNTLTRVFNIYKEYEPSDTESKERENIRSERAKIKGKKTRYESISELKEELEQLDKDDMRLGLRKYVDWVFDEVKEVKRVVSERKKNDTINDKNVIASIKWNDGFDAVNDIQFLVEEMASEGTISEAEKRLYNRSIKKIQGERSELVATLMNEAKIIFAKFVAKNNKEVEIEYQEKFEKEYKEQNIDQRGLSIYEYTTQKMKEYSDEMYEKAYEKAMERASKSDRDITKLSAIMYSEKNADSTEIGILSKAAEEADFKTSEFRTEETNKYDKQNQEFRKTHNSRNQKEKYKGMFSTSSSGQSYYASEYNPDFLEKMNDHLKKTFDRDLSKEAYGNVKLTKSDDGTLTYEINGEKRTLYISKGSQFNIKDYEDGQAVNVTYFIGGEKQYIEIHEAIARSEYTKWIKENTIKTHNEYGENVFIPDRKKWVNNEFDKLTELQKNQLKEFKISLRQADTETGGKNSLIKEVFGAEFIRLPGSIKTSAERITEGSYASSVKQQISELTQRQLDDIDSEEGRVEDSSIDPDEDLKYKRVGMDISNKEKQTIPVGKRARLKEKDQSFDLHTITLENRINARNYKNKKELEATFLIVLEVMKNRETTDTIGSMFMEKISSRDQNGKKVKLQKNKDHGMHNDAEKALDIIERRIWGVKTKDAGRVKIAGQKADVNALTRGYLKYSGFLSLIGNWMNSLVNLNMGTINNLVEAISGEHFTIKDWGEASKTYMSDMKGIMDDWGSNVDSSRTNMFLNVFNVLGGNSYLNSDFRENTKFESVMKVKSMRPIAKMGEHMMQAKVMYAVMHNIKVLNANGSYIDINGKVTKDKNKAASLDEMIEFKKNNSSGIVEMVLDKRVGSTTFTKSGGRNQILLETRNLIKHKVEELHGNHDPETQAAAQKYAPR